MNEHESIESAWERLRAGDLRAARDIVERLIASGDPAHATAAAHAIARHFERAAQQLARGAAEAQGETRARLTEEAVRALTFAALSTQLPDLTRPAAQGVIDPLQPATDLQSTGADRALDVTWVKSTSPGVIGQIVYIVRDGIRSAVTGTLAPDVQSTTIGNLENGTTYLWLVATIAPLGTAFAQATGTAGVVDAAIPEPAGLHANPSDGALELVWTDPSFAGTITGYPVELTGPNGFSLVQELPVSGTGPRSFTVTGLTNGETYRAAVRVIATVGGAAGKLGKEGVASGVPGITGTPFFPMLPQLPVDQLLLLNPNLIPEVVDAERLLRDVSAIAQAWPFDYLRERATSAAQRSLELDRQIVQLMSMTFDKAAVGQQQLTSAVVAALAALRDDTQDVSDVAGAIPVRDAVTELGDAVTRSLLFEAVLEWFFRTDAVELWLGFFDALLRDIASFDTGMSHVRDFFDQQYTGTFGTILRRLASEQLARVGPVVEQSLEPLRAAIGELTGSASRAMAEVFTAFDLPLLLNASNPEVRIANVNPLLGSLERLQAAVHKLETMLVTEIRASLADVIEGRAKELFRSLMIAYFVTPLLVALVVAILGGPIAAAVIAAIIAVGIEELLHLLARLLLGPLREQLEALDAARTAAFRQLQRAIANETPVGGLSAPKDYLLLARDELQQLSALLPQAFLDDAAALLGEARSRLLEGAQLHALAAERAAGFESASAFHRIRYAYRSALAPAPQLPGGTDEHMFAGAAVLSDLGALDTDRVRVADGRESVFTRRLSLFRLLGGVGDPVNATGVALGRFTEFLSSGRTAIELVSEALLDRTAPGMYRALIEDVELSALARLPIAQTAFAATGVAATLTHSGRSSTRIRRTSNRNAPPIDLPRNFPDVEAYVLATTFRAADAPPLQPNTVDAVAWSVIVNMTETKTWANVLRECARQMPAAVASLGNVRQAIRLEATASSVLAGFEPQNAIEDTRARYYSSQLSDSAATMEWLAVRITESQVITGVRIWPRQNRVGWPASYELQVSSNGTDYRTIAAPREKVVTTPGAEAVYLHFAPQNATHVRILAKELGSAGGDKFALQIADIAIELMNVTLIPAAISTITGPELSDHPWANLIAGVPGTFGSSPGSTSPDDPDARFVAALEQPGFVNMLRITPVAGQERFPTLAVGFQRGSHREPVAVHQIRSTEAFDVALPSYRSTGIAVDGHDLPQYQNLGFALQLTKIEAWSFMPRPAVMPAFSLEQAVTALVMAAQEPEQHDDLSYARAIATAIVGGVPALALPGLADRSDGLPGVARTTWQNARDEAIGQIAKWAGARMEDDPDPNVRGLDYVRLVQTAEPVSRSYMLVPDASADATATSVPLRMTGGDGSAARPGTFRNLGLDGVLELRIPDAAAAAIADVLLDVRVRACYDPRLAGAVEASRQQKSAQLAQVAHLGEGRLLTVGAPRSGVGSLAPTTTQISLRAHRDRILQTALAGAQVKSGGFDPPRDTIGGIDFDPAVVSGLAPGAPFRFFGNVVSTALSLVFARSLADTDTLAVQLPQIVLTPDMFGIDLPLLEPSLRAAGNVPPALVGLTIVLVPTHKGVAGGAGRLAPRTGSVDAVLAPLLPPEWNTPGTPLTLITMTRRRASGPPPEVALSSLWSTGARRGLTVDLGDAIANDALYDVIVGITLREALLTARTTE